jgi:hypothetical protein
VTCEIGCGDEWESYGPPSDFVGSVAPYNAVLARSDLLALTVHGFTVYSTGFEFTITIRLRPRTKRAELLGSWHEMLHGGPRHRGSPPAPSDLRIEIVYPDGTRYGNRAPWWEGPEPGEESGEKLHDPDGEFDSSTGKSRLSSLSPMGGSGNEVMSEATFWQSPLPGPGLMTFVCEWQAEGIARTEINVDTGSLLDAAARAIRVWG